MVSSRIGLCIDDLVLYDFKRVYNTFRLHYKLRGEDDYEFFILASNNGYVINVSVYNTDDMCMEAIKTLYVGGPLTEAKPYIEREDIGVVINRVNQKQYLINEGIDFNGGDIMVRINKVNAYSWEIITCDGYVGVLDDEQILDLFSCILISDLFVDGGV